MLWKVRKNYMKLLKNTNKWIWRIKKWRIIWQFHHLEFNKLWKMFKFNLKSKKYVETKLIFFSNLKNTNISIFWSDKKENGNLRETLSSFLFEKFWGYTKVPINNKISKILHTTELLQRQGFLAEKISHNLIAVKESWIDSITEGQENFKRRNRKVWDTNLRFIKSLHLQ